MPDPITNQLVNGMWSTIQTAVSSGLAMEVPYELPSPALDNVAFVNTTEKLSDTQPADWHTVQIPDVPAEISAQVRVQTAGDAFDIIHRYDLSYHELRAPNSDAIKNWAMRARQFELSLMLYYYAQQAETQPCTPGQLTKQFPPKGWGLRRCVVFQSASRAIILDRWKGSEMESAAVKVDAVPVNGVHALIFWMSGGPYVRRPADLSLRWTPAAECGAQLLLTEQLEFVDVSKESVFGIELVPFPQGAAGQGRLPHRQPGRARRQ
jgi:hypothetical protein